MKREKLDIIYQDKEIIVVNKPARLLTIGTDKEREKTLFHQVLEYEKKKHKGNKVFIVHRLDKDTSGIVILVKNEKIKKLLQDNWDNLALKRGYKAIVFGKLENTCDTITSYIKETDSLYSYSTDDNFRGKLAITKYKVIKSNKQYSLLDIEIMTGRKNQIRVHMKDINHPIVGDIKYGKKGSMRRMLLHADVLEIQHPITNKVMKFECKLPKEFDALFSLTLE